MLDFNDLETYLLVVDAGTRHGVDPSSSLESERFFRELLAQYSGELDKESVSNWLENQIQIHFLVVKDYPKWIQASEWPFADGKPMIFVGQIDLFSQEREIIKVYHDDTSLYVFIGANVEPVVVLQQF